MLLFRIFRVVAVVLFWCWVSTSIYLTFYLLSICWLRNFDASVCLRIFEIECLFSNCPDAGKPALAITQLTRTELPICSKTLSIIMQRQRWSCTKMLESIARTHSVTIQISVMWGLSTFSVLHGASFCKEIYSDLIPNWPYIRPFNFPAFSAISNLKFSPVPSRWSLARRDILLIYFLEPPPFDTRPGHQPPWLVFYAVFFSS